MRNDIIGISKQYRQKGSIERNKRNRNKKHKSDMKKLMYFSKTIINLIKAFA